MVSFVDWQRTQEVLECLGNTIVILGDIYLIVFAVLGLSILSEVWT